MPRRVRRTPLSRDYVSARSRFPDQTSSSSIAFPKYKIGHHAIQRLHTECLGRSRWNGFRRLSHGIDIRTILNCVVPETGCLTLRNLHTIDRQHLDREGIQLRASTARGRWCVRRDGSITVSLKFNGKPNPFNAPNDAVVPPDGGVWFMIPVTAASSLRRKQDRAAAKKPCIASIQLTKKCAVTDELFKPNGLAFSSDYRALHADTGHRTTTSPKNIKLGSGRRRSCNGREFVSMEMR